MPIVFGGDENGQAEDVYVRGNGYETCTERVDMRRRIIERMVSNPGYMAAIPLAVDDLRAEGDDEGADELERLAAEARCQTDTTALGERER